MDAATRRLVRQRADHRCEYCRLPQAALDAAFHVDHVTPKQHGGADSDDNLALACDRCNLHKGPNLTSFDPDSRVIVPLFNPRGDGWHDHFALDDSAIVGLTPTGRATVQLLQMNAPRRLRLRALLLARGNFDMA